MKEVESSKLKVECDDPTTHKFTADSQKIRLLRVRYMHEEAGLAGSYCSLFEEEKC